MLSPLAQLVLARIAAHEIVLGDETPMRQQDQPNKGYFWTFNNDALVAYVYSPNRSDETPRHVLGGTQGELVVDGYTDYNSVTTPDGRNRVGCNSHSRPRFCEALPTTPEAQHALDLYTEVFLVEHEAEDLGLLGTREHLALRQQRSGPAMRQLRDWCVEQQPRHLPKSKMGEAITYLLNNWDALTRFLDNSRIPVTNNQSERLLRVVAQGRKTYLTVGNTFAGECIAALYTMTACCKVAGVDPHAYFADVLDRIIDYPQHRLAELLPHNWHPPDAADSVPVLVPPD
jgi:transposase